MSEKPLSDYPWMKLHFSKLLFDCAGKSNEQIGEMMMSMIYSWVNNNYDALPNFAKYGADERFGKSKIYAENRSKPQHIVDKKEQLSTIVNNSEQLPISSISSLSSKSLKDSNKKIKYADTVFLLDDEYQKLVSLHGEENTKIFIEILDLYKDSKGKKYKSDYKAILSWVVDESKKRKRYTEKNLTIEEQLERF